VIRRLISTDFSYPCLLLSGLLVSGCATVHRDATPPVQSYQATDSQAHDTAGSSLRIMTVNIAHGRGESFHQLLQDTDTTVANLDSIATLLRCSGVDIVALQEADGPSFWSGNFNHVDYLANNGAFSQSVQGMHVDGLGLAYGTALMANLALSNPKAVTFDPSLSPVPKGFVVSTVRWPGSADIDVDIVSVHLDFASAAIRRQQAAELIETLRRRGHPVIIMGDFNDGWEENSTVRHISRALSLTAYSPEETGLETFPAFSERLDWILVSPELSFRSYNVLPDPISDHRSVLAEVTLNDTASATRLD
jgi:endonuclease/exonuclease/phosphatase family metal-dependent hydrolase